MRKFFEENITGILATIAFHILLFIVFLVIKISASSSHLDTEIVIDFTEFEELFDKNELPEDQMDKEGFEELFEQIKARNIAVNVREDFKNNISTEQYVEELMEELDIDDLNPDHSEDDLLSYDETIKKDDENKEPSENSKNTYSGVTNILYDIEGRNAKYMHIPVYKCESGGKVVIDIHVSQKGKVLSASINKTETKILANCLHEAAISAAYRSFFNTDFNAPLRQPGKITYIFIPQ